MDKMRNQLEVYRKHQIEYEWNNLQQQLDKTMSNLTTYLFFTDFGTNLDIGAAKIDICSFDNRVVVNIRFVIYGFRKVKIKRKNGVWDEMILNECDRWVIFGDTISKGKRN